MKILLLNSYDVSGGAARSAFRLLNGLKCQGVESTMLVQEKLSNDCNVVGRGTKLSRGIARLRPTLDILPLLFYPNRKKTTFSPAILPDRLPSMVQPLDPDLINLHWIGAGFMRLESLPKFGKPLVWTLHDSSAFTGGCHIPFDCTRYRQMCGACPALGSRSENDLSRKIWRRKQKAWKSLNLTVVTPSRWLADCARTSSLLNNIRVEVIPNGLDLQCYQPFDKKMARETLSLPKDKKLISFGNMSSINDKNKGFNLLHLALKVMCGNDSVNNVELMVFGEAEPGDDLDIGIKVNYIGQLDDDKLPLVYSAADVFVVPSIQENLPNTIMESLACGTPVVAFDVGGIPDMVEHRKNGYLARPFDTKDLARGIEWLLDQSEKGKNFAAAARGKAVSEYSLERQAGRYIKLYEELLANE